MENLIIRGDLDQSLIDDDISGFGYGFVDGSGYGYGFGYGFVDDSGHGSGCGYSDE